MDDAMRLFQGDLTYTEIKKMPIDELVEIMKARGRSLQKDENYAPGRDMENKLKRGGAVRKFGK